MAKIKTKVYLETVKKTEDNINWVDGTESEFEISTLEQEDGLETVVSIENPYGVPMTYPLSEMRELLRAMENVERSLGD